MITMYLNFTYRLLFQKEHNIYQTESIPSVCEKVGENPLNWVRQKEIFYSTWPPVAP